MRHTTRAVVPPRWLALGLMIMSLSTLACGFVGGAFGAAPAAVPTAEFQKVPITFEVATPAVTTTVPMESAVQPIAGPLETIVITTPLPNQGVRDAVRVAGIADPTFEQRLSILVRDQTGRVIGSALAQIQAPIGQRGPYSATVQLPANLPPQPGRVIVYAISPRDGGPVQLSSVEVQLSSDAPSNVAVSDPNQREAIVITAPQPGATLRGSAHVVAETMFVSDLVIEVRGPNNETLGRVTRTLENAEGLPAPLIVDVPFRVYSDPPGRIVIYVIHPRDGKTVHLSSVEVNLQP
ncbi:MAG TPA: Gmad2 immunoglobulin-like domain-containing protein [Anaerolineae bacterium]|nr:Gmad2 immunoglobulin-like domain-containing protein [Anaerolineae bacterium]